MFSNWAVENIFKWLPRREFLTASLAASLIVSLTPLFRHLANATLVQINIKYTFKRKVKRSNLMRSKQFLYGFLVLALFLAGCAPIVAPVSAKDMYSPNKISAELIGQVLNASPEVSAQYGYISYLSGFDTAALIASGDVLSEQSALLTFYNDTTVESVINNGPMRVIDRSGEATFYFNTTPAGDFGDPETFRAGVAVMKASLRHQVILDTVTGAFTAHFDCIVISNEPFTIAEKNYQLGEAGQPFEVTFSGHLNPQAPPSGHMGGFITGLEVQATKK